MDGKAYAVLAAVIVVAAGAGGAFLLLPGGNGPGDGPLLEASGTKVFLERGSEVLEFEAAEGTTVRSVVTATVTGNGHSMDVRANGTISSVDGEAAPEGMAWVTFQWRPPQGWKAIVLMGLYDADMVGGTSYCVSLSAVSHDAKGNAVYSEPFVRPHSWAYFFIKFTKDVNANDHVLSMGTEEERRDGYWISGMGTDAADAFRNACADMGYELNMSTGVKPETGEVDMNYYGWLFSFAGLGDVNEGGGLYTYWSQYHWDAATGKWEYSSCLGHYDTGVWKYFGFHRQTTVDDQAPSGLESVRPSDVPSGLHTEKARHAVQRAESENGRFGADWAEAPEGAKVVVRAVPAEGYEVSAVTVDGTPVPWSEEDMQAQFVMPAGSVTVSVQFSPKAP